MLSNNIFLLTMIILGIIMIVCMFICIFTFRGHPMFFLIIGILCLSIGIFGMLYPKIIQAMYDAQNNSIIINTYQDTNEEDTK